jgi:hypothetical protein
VDRSDDAVRASLFHNAGLVPVRTTATIAAITAIAT